MARLPGMRASPAGRVGVSERPTGVWSSGCKREVGVRERRERGPGVLWEAAAGGGMGNPSPPKRNNASKSQLFIGITRYTHAHSLVKSPEGGIEVDQGEGDIGLHPQEDRSLQWGGGGGGAPGETRE